MSEYLSEKFVQSLCKNLERAETKKWLTEMLETLMKVTKCYSKEFEMTKNNFRKELLMNKKMRARS